MQRHCLWGCGPGFSVLYWLVPLVPQAPVSSTLLPRIVPCSSDVSSLFSCCPRSPLVAHPKNCHLTCRGGWSPAFLSSQCKCKTVFTHALHWDQRWRYSSNRVIGSREQFLRSNSGISCEEKIAHAHTCREIPCLTCLAYLWYFSTKTFLPHSSSCWKTKQQRIATAQALTSAF